jgi:hypothetical protein
MDPHELARFNTLIHKLDLIERKVDFLYRHLGIAFVDQRPPPNEIEQFIIDGNRIAALKVYQKQHNVGLLEAKNAIEELAAKLGL